MSKIILGKYIRSVVVGILVLTAVGLCFVAAMRMVKDRLPVEIDNSAEKLIQQAVTTCDDAKSRIVVHKVSEHETLSEIATKYKLDLDTLRGANPSLTDSICQGDEILILPEKGMLYTAEEGDSLWQLASYYNTTVETIVMANGKHNSKLIAGEKLFIPGAKLERDIPVSRGTTVRLTWPTEGSITSVYGTRWGRLHAGIDIANEEGTAVKAARGGKVRMSGWGDGYGNMIILDHGQNLTTIYGHLSSYIVHPGDYIKAGQTIAYTGNTGDSTGPHLHFEVRVKGEPVNPQAFLP